MALQFLRHGSNAILITGIVVFTGLAVAGRITYPWWSVAIGFLVFFLSEYNTHRFILHARPSKNAFVYKLQRRLHYDHHIEPTKLDLLFFPWWAFVPIVIAYAAIYWLIARDAGVVVGVLLGNFLGVFYYEWVHYVAHVSFQPLTPFGRWIKKYHLWHHYKNERMWFGVTNPSFDYLYRTYAGVTEVEKSGTTRVLFQESK